MKGARSAKLGVAIAVWAALLVCGCSERQRNLVSDPKNQALPDSGSIDAHTPSAADSGKNDAPAADSGAFSSDAATAYCGRSACSCDDGVDNDNDGLKDGLDPECTGAYDDDEASFATGRPTKQMPCRDCYWDANSGSGDDQCRYPAECFNDSNFVGKGNCGSCSVSERCDTYCKARTPNGCDCFGCCAVETPGGDVIQIQLVDTCTMALAADRSACPRCTLHETCRNDCARCELCPGKRLADLPADCRSGSGPGYACDPDVALCSSKSPCQQGRYCLQGCCVPDLL